MRGARANLHKNQYRHSIKNFNSLFSIAYIRLTVEGIMVRTLVKAGLCELVLISGDDEVTPNQPYLNNLHDCRGSNGFAIASGVAKK